MSNEKQLSASPIKSIETKLMENKATLEKLLPKYLSVDRMLKLAMTTFRLTPKLMECDVKSLVAFLIKCATVKLEPGNELGHVYAIPFGKECTFILGYKGMVQLAYRSHEVLSIESENVFVNDHFVYERGIYSKLEHIPVLANRGEWIGTYAIGRLKNGGIVSVFLTKAEVLDYKKRSRASGSSSSPWNHPQDCYMMYKKTAVRRLFTFLPCTEDMTDAVAFDETSGDPYEGNIIDGETEPQKSREELRTDKLHSSMVKTKFQKPEDQQNHDDGELTPEAQKEIDDFFDGVPK